ncbi:hypothetical protein [Streptomyces alfalfae]|uniref:Uncharacterized protein n=1 Tax=Streptomyces alfalfae TaxID=1642299 RepID=A0A7T4PEF3_9ACTN|nr:hypothetical protein [Streptomyces alfalfae]QQC88674.1 hypothetical protein I8755_09825 [Streptomyces alfalfae]QUI31131.1 hypothetical protein H9W91_09890 [Streptomyces alfalfae]
MRLGKALATGIAEERPRPSGEHLPEENEPAREDGAAAPAPEAAAPEPRPAGVAAAR